MKIISKEEAINLSLNRYFTGKPCKRDHISERYMSGACIECTLQPEKKEKARIYYLNTSEERKATNKIYRDNNKEKEHQRVRKWERENRDSVNARKRKAYAENEHIRINARKATANWVSNNKERVSENFKNWRKANPEQMFTRKTLERIENNWRGSREKMEKRLDYTWYELKSHIESQFKEGMSWENRSEWHIDHIKPIKIFLDEGENDIKIINSLSNLQPLWAFENKSKSAKY